jgi:RecB family endonuclease NucS
MTDEEHDAAVDAFIRANGVTRCPTACAGRTQGSVGEADRVVLRKRDEHFEVKREERYRQAASRGLAITSAFRAGSPP